MSYIDTCTIVDTHEGQPLDTSLAPRYVQRMSIQLQHDKINEGILAGKLMEVFEAYYAATVTMQENDAPACVGKDANRERELHMVAAAETMHGVRLLSSAVAGDVSFSEWEFDVTYKGAPRMVMRQVSVRRWNDGKVVAERFYHK